MGALLLFAFILLIGDAALRRSAAEDGNLKSIGKQGTDLIGGFVTSNHEKVLEYRDSYLAVVECKYLAAKQKVEL